MRTWAARARDAAERLRPGAPAAWSPSGLDLAVAALLVVWSAVPLLWFGRDRPGVPLVDPVRAALGLVQALPLLWRRRAPVAALVAGGLAVVLGFLVVPRLLPAGIALLLVTYSVPRYSRRRTWAVGDWLAWVVAAVVLMLFSRYVFAYRLGAPDSLFLLYLAAAWATGRVRRQYLDLVDREREHHTQQALAAERTRIARELHDLLAHSMSSMVVLAGVAQRMTASRPDRVAELLAAIESTGRDGLTETQRLLGVLRSSAEAASQEPGDGTGAALAPAPRLQRLDELVEPARSAGLEVQVAVEGEPVPLPGGVELSGYRIVQEAITNILRHAGATRVWLVLRYQGEELEVEVLDNGTPRPGDGGGGYGLVGMRERAVTAGGSLEAGPRPGGGWQVLARLPTGEGEAR